MEEISAARKSEKGLTQFYMIEQPDGSLKCSCGRELIKKDENTYQCPGGYPTYRVSDMEVIKDKYGRLWARNKDHDSSKNKGEI